MTKSGYRDATRQRLMIALELLLAIVIVASIYGWRTRDLLPSDGTTPVPAFTLADLTPFVLPEAGHVTLSVFDALGREVATLVNQTLPAGSYTTDFKAEQLPSGVYFYKLVVNGTLLSRTMTLQK